MKKRILVMLTLALTALPCAADRYKCETRDYVHYQHKLCGPGEQQTLLEKEEVETPQQRELRLSHEEDIKALRQLSNQSTQDEWDKRWQEDREKCRYNKELARRYHDNEYIIKDASIAIKKYCH